jgi:plasmid stabilization system protein ParE
MKLRFTPRAAQDLASIAAYIRERNPPAALRVRAAILESLQSLALASKIAGGVIHLSIASVTRSGS